MSNSINLLDPAPAKVGELFAIARSVVAAAAPNATADEHHWRAWFQTYLMWHESAQLATRRQFNNGPGRGLMQFEATTAWDTIKLYVLGPTPGLVRRLADAANVEVQSEMAPALQAFGALPNPGNVWPAASPASRVECWLLNNDRFGIALMQIHLERFGAALPPFPPVLPTADPRDPKFRSQHAEAWADEWWKGPAAERPARLQAFHASAAALNLALGIP